MNELEDYSSLGIGGISEEPASANTLPRMTRWAVNLQGRCDLSSELTISEAVVDASRNREVYGAAVVSGVLTKLGRALFTTGARQLTKERAWLIGGRSDDRGRCTRDTSHV